MTAQLHQKFGVKWERTPILCSKLHHGCHTETTGNLWRWKGSLNPAIKKKNKKAIKALFLKGCRKAIVEVEAGWESTALCHNMGEKITFHSTNHAHLWDDDREESRARNHHQRAQWVLMQSKTKPVRWHGLWESTVLIITELIIVFEALEPLLKLMKWPRAGGGSSASGAPSPSAPFYSPIWSRCWRSSCSLSSSQKNLSDPF